ncbi:MAG TPA: hypothetical protein PLN52_01645 [Opitutaceae bacterium]|nr:hypothetical protein [Opitutaceae bacterium]
MLIEIEVQEDDRGLGYYCGDIDKSVLDAIVDGTHNQPFIRLTEVFWPATRPAKEDFQEEIDYVVRYGTGDRQNYVGDIYVKKAHIVLMSPLKSIAHRNGRRLGDLSAEKKEK